MIAMLQLNQSADRAKVEQLLSALALDPADVALDRGARATAAQGVHQILADIAARGDQAIVDVCRRFDDPSFTLDQLRVTPQEMKAAADRITPQQRTALDRSIAQVREYQSHIMPPQQLPLLHRPGVELGLRFTPLDSAGLYFPGGKAAYPSSLIMLAVPAQVAGVKQVVVCTPPSRYGRIDLVLATCHALGLEHVYRAGGAAAIGAMAFGTQSIPRVDKIVGPGNMYVQLAKRAVSGGVGIDGYLGPSEILVLADDSAQPAFIASDLIAQAEHDPGSCYLLTDSLPLATAVSDELSRQLKQRHRAQAIESALDQRSAIIIGSSMDELIPLANRFAAEHVNVQVRDTQSILPKLVHGGAFFVGPYSPIAAGDYVAGPSHCLPTNTTARFTSGVSVYEFLKRSSIVQYEKPGLAADARAIITLAECEGLDGHAASIRARDVLDD